MRRWSRRQRGRGGCDQMTPWHLRPETNESIGIKLFISLFTVKAEGWWENGKKGESNKDVTTGGRRTAAQVLSSHSNLGQRPRDAASSPTHLSIPKQVVLFPQSTKGYCILRIRRVLSQKSGFGTSYKEWRKFGTQKKTRTFDSFASVFSEAVTWIPFRHHSWFNCLGDLLKKKKLWNRF